MKIIKTKFKDLFLYKKDTFSDNRGFFRELFLQKNIKKKFPFDVISLSNKNVIRGLHIQLKNPQGKLLTVLSGKIFDVALDCRKRSKTYGKIFTVYLSHKDNTSLYIPEGFAHGFQALEAESELLYLHTAFYNHEAEGGINYGDPSLNINWPLPVTDLSVRDTQYAFMKREYQGINI